MHEKLVFRGAKPLQLLHVSESTVLDYLYILGLIVVTYNHLKFYPYAELFTDRTHGSQTCHDESLPHLKVARNAVIAV